MSGINRIGSGSPKITAADRKLMTDLLGGPQQKYSVSKILTRIAAFIRLRDRALPRVNIVPEGFVPLRIFLEDRTCFSSLTKFEAMVQRHSSGVIVADESTLMLEDLPALEANLRDVLENKKRQHKAMELTLDELLGLNRVIQEARLKLR